MNKKGLHFEPLFWLLTIVLLTVVSVFIIFEVNEVKNDNISSERDFVGGVALELLGKAQESERMLTYLDQAALLAVDQAQHLAAISGFSSGCGEYHGISIWQTMDEGKIKQCKPNVKQAFIFEFNNELKGYLKLLPLLSSEYEIYINNLDNNNNKLSGVAGKYKEQTLFYKESSWEEQINDNAESFNKFIESSQSLDSLEEYSESEESFETNDFIGASNQYPSEFISTTSYNPSSKKIQEAKTIYTNFKKYIDEASNKYDIPAQLITSLIQKESNGEPDAYNPSAQATGLMQIIPPTAFDLCGYKTQKQFGTTNWKKVNEQQKQQIISDLKVPKNNIDCGSKILSSYLNSYDGNPFKGLSAYNAGPGRVNGWLSDSRNSWKRWESLGYPCCNDKCFVGESTQDYYRNKQIIRTGYVCQTQNYAPVIIKVYSRLI